MQQFYSSISFCVRHISYLFILCLPVMTVEVALAHLVMSMGVGSNMSNSAALELISSISGQLFVLVALSLILSVGLSGELWLRFKVSLLAMQHHPINHCSQASRNFFHYCWEIYFTHSLMASVLSC